MRAIIEEEGGLVKSVRYAEDSEPGASLIEAAEPEAKQEPEAKTPKGKSAKR
jgi:hypothetical protein